LYGYADAIQSTAAKLKDPILIGSYCVLPSSTSQKEMSLIEGLPGVLCFFTSLCQHFPNDGWEDVGISYFLALKERLSDTSISDLSLFTGVLGIAIATHRFAQHVAPSYHGNLCNLDDLCAKVIREDLTKRSFNREISADLPPSQYDISSGLSGVLMYLLQRRDNPGLFEQAESCTQKLIGLFSISSQHEDHFSPPSWTIQPSSTSIAYEAGTRVYCMDVPYGLPGLLAALSLAIEAGVNVPTLKETVRSFARWMIHRGIQLDGKVNWEKYIPHYAPRSDEYPSAPTKELWLFGAPGVLRCLYLAGRALKDESIERFAVESYLSHLEDPGETALPEESSFCAGLAGLLTLTSEMAFDTQDPKFYNIVKTLEAKIVKLYNPDHLFGFKSSDHGKDGSHSVDDPRLYTGAAGVAFSLLNSLGRLETKWTNLFAI